MQTPVMTLTLTADGSRTTVPVTAQLSPGPSGYEAFTYVDVPPPRHPEIGAAALRSTTALHAFLRTLLRSDHGETPVWILEPRLPRLRELLGVPTNATAPTIVL